MRNKNKKGFTLVELLGVIVVLAILALITIPIISNVVANARINALRDSAYGLVEASNLYYVQKEVNENTRFDKNEEKDTLKELSYKGVVKIGTVIIDKKGNVTVCITDGKNSAYKNYNESKVTTSKGKVCNIRDNSSIVYLDDEATITQYDNSKLTELVNNLENKVSDLQSQIDEKASITSLNTKADKTELSELDTRLSASISQLSSDISDIDDKIYTPVSLYARKEVTLSSSGGDTGLAITIPANSYFTLQGSAGCNRNNSCLSRVNVFSNGSFWCSSDGNWAVFKDCTYSSKTGTTEQTFNLYAYPSTTSDATFIGYFRGYYFQKQS